MKILITGTKCIENLQLAEDFLKKLKDRYVTVDIWPDNQRITNTDIKECQTDLLITFDLQGFQYCTLTDGIAYNLLDCKQVHFLLGRDLENEKYLAKQLSIAMFFFCANQDYYEYLLEKYPEIPYLEKIGGEEDISGISDALVEAVAAIVSYRVSS